METKVAQAVKLYESGNERQALKIAKGFRIGISKEEQKQMTRGYECTHSASFYEMLGMNPTKEFEKAKQIFVKRIYEPYKRTSEKQLSYS